MTVTNSIFTPATVDIPWQGLEWVAWFVLFSGLVLILANLLRNGRLGWAWPVLVATAALMRFLFRIAASMFIEITADPEGIGNWDDD